MVYIANFTIPRNLIDVEDYFDNGRKSNIDYILEDFIYGSTSWSCPKKAQPGDICLFMCAKSARSNLGMATSHIPDSYTQEFQTFVEHQKKLYKEYSGNILGCGRVASVPEYQEDYNRWYAEIDQLRQFPVPIPIDEFRSFITVSPTSSITFLNNDQWERIRWLVNQKTPGFFQNVTAPDTDTLEDEFERAVRKETSKTLDQLRKAAKKKSAPTTVSIVKSKSYRRDPTIAAYVKKRANGRCQLCGEGAPFIDQTGEPYLECHHIIWLSEGGEDSVENCVALCPNCHRKMHIINDPIDILKLRKKAL